jgi:hypothetical protein
MKKPLVSPTLKVQEEAELVTDVDVMEKRKSVPMI